MGNKLWRAKPWIRGNQCMGFCSPLARQQVSGGIALLSQLQWHHSVMLQAGQRHSFCPPLSLWLGNGTCVAILNELPNESPCPVLQGTLLLFASVDSGFQPMPPFIVVLPVFNYDSLSFCLLITLILPVFDVYGILPNFYSIASPLIFQCYSRFLIFLLFYYSTLWNLEFRGRADTSVCHLDPISLIALKANRKLFSFSC